jgi:hypothetical protein
MFISFLRSDAGWAWHPFYTAALMRLTQTKIDPFTTKKIFYLNHFIQVTKIKISENKEVSF